MGLRKSPGFYALTLLHAGCFTLFYAALWGHSLSLYHGPARLLGWFKAALEILASLYFFSVVLKSLDYLLSPERGSPGLRAADAREKAPRDWPPVACIYLCAGDLNERAFESLCRLDYPGRYDVYVHDDSGDPREAGRLDDVTRDLAARTGRRIFVIRRPTRVGGKPGAVNHVLACLPESYPFLLLADSDSTAVDARALEKVLPLFDDPRVAVVQSRNVAVGADGDGRINACLRRAIEVFDLFARHQFLHGMALFLGHNAVLRAKALTEVGGLREGLFADDIDLSVRLVRRGWRILYAPQVPFGETHPASYAAFRRRAYKWAYGCGQILRRHLVPVLLDRRMSLPQKLGLLEFAGFYAFQALLITYLVVAGIALPAVSGPPSGPAAGLFLSGAAIVLSIFLPSYAYHARRGIVSEWWPFALVCAVVYGSVAFTSARGLLEGIAGRTRRWVPTNAGPRTGRVTLAMAMELVFGLLLFLVPACLAPPALLQPSMYLFAAVFLLTPFVAVLYVPAGDGPPPIGRRSMPTTGRTALWVVLGLVSLGASLHLARCARSSEDGAARARIEDERLVVGGKRFAVQGIYYSPWLPGTGPMKDYPWPEDERVSRDLSMIRELGANTILVHDAPERLFRLAREQRLMVIYTYFINWQSIGDDTFFQNRAREIVRSTAEIAREPNLLAILLGNEVVEWVLKQRGRAFIEARLRDLYGRVKEVAPDVPVSHANWPVGRELDLSFMDLACFNLYPAWPREVVVAGYGNYIENVLKPIAAGRPLLITEFGQNSLEASDEKQAQVLRECWTEIRSRTAGGVVFSFADEWWKNYDNPVEDGEWWERKYAPEDERTRDLDPEEYYGIVTSERAPKPAYWAVRGMFVKERSPALRVALYALPLLALMGYTVYLFTRGIFHDQNVE